MVCVCVYISIYIYIYNKRVEKRSETTYRLTGKEKKKHNWLSSPSKEEGGNKVQDWKQGRRRKNFKENGRRRRREASKRDAKV
jgi:uncharacterized ion transporter superfamily protein YfcC